MKLYFVYKLNRTTGKETWVSSKPMSLQAARSYRKACAAKQPNDHFEWVIRPAMTNGRALLTQQMGQVEQDGQDEPDFYVYDKIGLYRGKYGERKARALVEEHEDWTLVSVTASKEEGR